MSTKKSLLILLLFLLMFPGYLQAQHKKNRKQRVADDYFNSLSYLRAYGIYKGLAADTSNHIAIKRMAECSYLLNRWKESEELLRQVVSFHEIEPRYYLLYSQALKSNGKQEESDEWMQKFHDLAQQDSRGLNFIHGKNEWENMMSSPSPYHIAPASFNSVEADFAPGFYEDGRLVFISARGNTRQIIPSYYSWNERPFLDVFVTGKQMTKDSSVVKLLPGVNTSLHDGPVCFDSTYSAMYVSRNTSGGKGSGKEKSSMNQLKIYLYRKVRDTWTEVRALPFNINGYSTGHPCLSPDQKRLYFVSDRPGGIGGTDIYFVEIKPDGAFGPVTNAGRPVNTEGNEMFPFINNQGTLFFSSDGHPGIGRLDIFSAPFANGVWGPVANAGNGINSPQDDFGIIFSKDGTHGYFSSNRSGGKGDDDIYQFTADPPIKLETYSAASSEKTAASFKTLIFHDKYGSASLQGVPVTCTRYADGQIQTVVIGEGGEAKISLPDTAFNDQEVWNVKVEGYFAKDIHPADTVAIEVSKPVMGMDVGREIEMKPIYFDVGKSEIRADAARELDKMVEVLKVFPDMIIELGSHTDSRGSDVANLALSEKRAGASAEYIISRGISRERIQSRGYGESRLLNRCGNGVNCTESEHEINWRIEFVIKKL